MHGTTQIITVANLKGGSGKTTTVAHLGAAIAATGLVVWIVDADPQGSALRWSEQAEWTIPTLALPVRNLHAKLAGRREKRGSLVPCSTRSSPITPTEGTRA